jgi:hypothetical protein
VMSDTERQELRAELEIKTGWNDLYIKKLSDEKLLKEIERVRG